MLPPSHTCRLAVTLGLFLALGACKKPGRVDLLLRPPENLDLTRATEVEVRLLDARDDHEIDRGTVAGSALDSLPGAIDKSAMDPGVPYVFEIRAPVPPDVCPSGRIVGRSLPIEIKADDSTESATMYVACANGVAPTGRMSDPRAAHGAIFVPSQGAAFVVGGASDINFLGIYTPIDSVERYDVTTGRFSQTPDLLEPRFTPGVVLDPMGRVVVLGGGDGDYLPGSWRDTVEEIDGDARRYKGLMDSKWLRPRVLPLSDGTYALLGLGLDELHVAQVAFYDPIREIPTRPYVERPSRTYNGNVVAMPGRDRALLFGATGDREEAQPTLFINAACAQDACFLDLGDPDDTATWGPGVGWQEAAGAWLACPAGGGTVTMAGGRLGADETALGDIYCYRDTDPPGGGLVRIGTLAHPRRLHGMVAVRPGRILVVGGTDGGDDGLDQAELLHVDPCACTPLGPADVEELPTDPSLGAVGRILIGGSEAMLGDGTVLLAGAASALAAGRLEADDDAWIFMPDLGP